MSAHRKPRPAPWYRRLLARLRTVRQRRQAEDIEIAQHDANMVRIEAHAPPPLAWARHALAARLAAYSEAIAAAVPPAAVLPDEADERWPHLDPAYDDDTHAFGLSITEAGQ